MNYNMQEVETGFNRIKSEHRNDPSKATGIEDVLQFMLDHQQKIWWWAWEFMSKTNSKGVYLSHRACARVSDLAIHHPDLVEDRRIGRFKVYRLRVENMDKIIEFIPSWKSQQTTN